MKKYFIYLSALVFFGAVLTMSSCNPDDDPAVIDDPTVTAPASAPTAIVGEVITIDFAVNAPGTVASIAVTASEGTAVTISPNPIIGETSGVVTVTYTAPLTEGDRTVTLTVTDAQATAKTGTGDAVVTVSFTPASSTELLVAKFDVAPTLDGTIDEMWNTAQRLVSTATVPSGLGARNTYFNADGLGEETLDIYEAYEGETENFTMRSAYVGTDIYFLIEWDDAVDSKDRQSWYFDAGSQRWKGEHKYANASDDKFYEDKFAFLFPIGTVDNFEASTCYASCHSTGGVIANTGDKHTRHYLKGVDQKIDMWHWKRVRGTHNDRIDDQRITYVADPYDSGSNGRSGDADGQSGYSNNSQTLTITGTAVDVNVPLYIIPDGTDYYWIPEAQLGVEAKLVVAVSANGTLTLDGGATINPNDGGFEQGTGVNRVPSILTRDFTGGRADLTVKAVHTGTGWVAEVHRKLNTSDVDDVVFDITKEFPFGFAIFNNAAIAHAIKPGLLMKFEQ